MYAHEFTVLTEGPSVSSMQDDVQVNHVHYGTQQDAGHIPPPCMNCLVRVTDSTQAPPLAAPQHYCGGDPLCFICNSADTPSEIKLKEELRIEREKHDETKKIVQQLRRRIKTLNQKMRRGENKIQRYQFKEAKLKSNTLVCLDVSDEEVMQE
jgi:hypothetical protein